MDDLVAAASVLAMKCDSEAQDDMEQEVDAGEHGRDLLETGTQQCYSANKENERGLPDSRALGAANKEVLADYSNLFAAPSDLSDTRYHLPVDQPLAAPVRRWQWLHCSCWRI
jgi:hypothetical protein